MARRFYRLRNKKGQFTRSRRSYRRSGRKYSRRSRRSGRKSGILGKFTGGKKILGASPLMWLALIGAGVWYMKSRQSESMVGA